MNNATTEHILTAKQIPILAQTKQWSRTYCFIYVIKLPFFSPLLL